MGVPRNGSTPDSIGVCAVDSCVINKQRQRLSRDKLVCLGGFIFTFDLGRAVQ